MWNIGLTLLPSLFLPVFASTDSTLPPISVQEYAARRAALAREIQDGVFFLEGGREPKLEIRFQQEDDFSYLTGVESQDAALLLRVAKGKIAEEILFLPKKDPNWERWNGPRLSPGEEAEKLTGIAKTAENDTRELALQKALSGSKKFDATRKALDTLQVKKSPAEIARLERAIRITEKGFEAAAKLLRPGAFEYELMGAIEGTYLKNGAEGFGFPSIVGSGPNSCRLHYQANRRQMQDGELVVMDIGAEFEHYSADITRTLPVSGKFSPRQAQVYRLVLEAQKRAIAAARPGIKVADVHAAAKNYLAENKVAEHFWHSTSHFLGLRTHDTPTSYEEPLRPGMVITVEPGLYYPEENLGVRIEDDILITENGCTVLSNGIPREIEEVEAWIRKFRQ